jgi:iron complex outermembrane receptor protein
MKGTENDLDSSGERQSFDISKSFNFFNPKVGLTYALAPNQSMYASFSRAHREPVRDDFVNAPADQLPKPEEMNDLEAGWRLRNLNYSLSANYYYMGYHDQLVLTGAVNDVGASLRTNVDKSYRTGIELEGSTVLSKKFTLGANLTLSQNKVLNFTEVLYDYGADFDQYNVIEKKYKTTDISFSPNVIAGGIFSYKVFKGLELSWLTKFVGKQYLDNTSNESRKIDSYFINDLRAIYTMYPKHMREISVSMFVNNLFNVQYQSNGYTYGYFAGSEIRQNYYYPQAGTNFMAMLALRF